MKCKHCSAEYEGNFCPECGARAETPVWGTPPSVQQSPPFQQPVAPPMQINTAPAKRPKKPKKPIYKKWWFYVLLAIAAIVIIAAISSNSGGRGKHGEEIEWSKVELRSQLPEPPSSRGTLYENSEEEFWASLDDVTDDQYNDYLRACIDRGFTVDAVKNSYSYKAYNSDGYSLDMSHIGDGLSITLEAPMKFGPISWPTSTIGKLLPTPKSTTGKFSHEREDSFFVYVGNTTKAEYDQYVADCVAKGFTVDYDKGDTYYKADNADGYHISLRYEGYNIMSVEIKAPESDDASTFEQATTETDTAENTDVEAIGAESANTESTTPPDATESNTDSNGLRSDFKEAMDSYEEFIDEYVAFLKKYMDNPDDISLLNDYYKYLSKYDDMLEKFEKWEGEDLNDAELAYYLDVQARVTQKLLEVAEN